MENLQAHQITLMKDVANLDQMFELNAKYQQELTMYILAGKQRLAQIQREDLAQLPAAGRRQRDPGGCPGVQRHGQPVQPL